MISINGIEYLKAMAEAQADIIPGGALYILSDRDSVIWRKASKGFDLGVLKVGDRLNENSIEKRAFNLGKPLTENIPRSQYGIRLKVSSEVLVDDDGKPAGVFSTILPRLHPVAASFDDFAPIMAEMFPEGAFLYVTDLQKIINRGASKKFDINEKQLGDRLKQDDVAAQVIRTKQHVSMELDRSIYGVPAFTTCYPLFDEDNAEEVVATLGVVIPKILAGNLRQMSGNLESSLSGIASTIEEMAASASSIHANEQETNNGIKEIIVLSEEINQVSAFIKEIADQTKMLGLNAAIEAARAGESGRGFGVVAQEIRNLSEQSKGTVPKIKELTDRIKAKVNETSEKSQSSLAASEEQAAATEEITASIEEITGMSTELNKIAMDL